MAYQETTRTSYGSKVKNSFQGIFGGLILIIAGSILLWWNEGRAVKSSNALKDFQKNYVEMSDINTINPELEGKAIHATGVATTDEILRDAAFGIAVNAFHLTRDVEYYQWTEQSSSESKDKLGGSTETTTTYTYEPDWCSEPVNSAEFKDPAYKGKNFVWRSVEDLDQQASNATFGAYRLTPSIIGSISGDEPVEPSLTEEQMKQMLAKVSDTTVVVTVRGNQVYIGADPDIPHIGDVRITFNQVTSPKTISILQKVVNGTFESYIAKNGKSFSKVEMGTVSATNMIEHQKSANKLTLWLLRLLGVLLVVGGFKSLLSLISTLFAVVPFVQRIIGAGIGVVTTLVGLVWSLVVIALAWVAYRPVLAISLLVLAAALIIWLVSRSRKKKLNNVASLLVIVLMVALAGCSGGSNTDVKVDTPAGVDFSTVKGPVETVWVTNYYGEGEPGTTVYSYNEKGDVIGEREEWDEAFEGDYSRLENLCEKDDQGRYTKEVYGSDGQPEQTIYYEYNDKGDVTMSESQSADGGWQSTTRNRYDADGRLIMSSYSSPYGENSNTYEYDDQGRQVKSSFYSNGKLYSTSENTLDGNGNTVCRKETFHQLNKVNEYFNSYDEKGEFIANRNYVNDEKGYRLEYSDSTFTDSKGLRHQRIYSNYGDDPHSYEGIFNKQDNLTHYEFFEGQASNPKYILDFNYDKDGVTLRDIEWKELSLGTVKNTRTRSFVPRHDTFGNWTRRTSGISYLPDLEYTSFDNIDDMMPETIRKIKYRGEDQGQNYGFEGKAENADVRLTCTEDNGVFFGRLNIDGNEWRAVGNRDKDDNLYFVALEEDGEIPWSLSIPAGSDKRNASLFDMRDMDPDPVAITLNPTRKNLKTYAFTTTGAEIPGLYCYVFKDGSTSGQLDVSRCGENWENVQFKINNEWNGDFPKIASDEQSEYFGDNTEFYLYKWDEGVDRSLRYSIRFFDGFAVITILDGNPNDFFPIGTTVAGIYAQLPSVG